jgi:mRNA interferase MazF
MMICYAMSSKIKGYVFEVIVSTSPPSAVLADQVKSLDWQARGATSKGKVDSRTSAEVRAKLKAVLLF